MREREWERERMLGLTKITRRRRKTGMTKIKKKDAKEPIKKEGMIFKKENTQKRAKSYR